MPRSPNLRISDLLRPHWKALTLALVAVVGETLADVLEPWPIKIVIDNIVQSKPLPHWLAGIGSGLFSHDRFAVLNFAVAAVALIAVTGAASTYAEKYLTTTVSQWVAHDLRLILYHHIQRLSLAEHDQVRDRVIIQAMRSHKTQQTIVVSPYKIEKYYNENLDQYKVGEQIKLRMIFIKRGEPIPAVSITEHTPSASTNQLSQTNSETVAATTNLEATTAVPTTTVSEATTTVTNTTEATATNATATAATNETNPPAIVAAPAVPAMIDLQRKLADEILAKLDTGESFESMAKVYSEGKEAKEGGDWGWIGKDVLRKELNETAFSLKAGQHSGVIETAEGYYILHVEDVKPAHTVALAEVRDDIEKILLQQQRAKMQEDWVKDLRAKAYIHLF